MIESAANSAAVECGNCGCPDVAFIDSGRTFGRVLRAYVCRHCGRRWRGYVKRQGSGNGDRGSTTATPRSPIPDPRSPVQWIYGRPLRCTRCKTRGLVKSTRKGLRYCKCPKCKFRWKETGRAV